MDYEKREREQMLSFIFRVIDPYHEYSVDKKADLSEQIIRWNLDEFYHQLVDWYYQEKSEMESRLLYDTRQKFDELMKTEID